MKWLERAGWVVVFLLVCVLAVLSAGRVDSLEQRVAELERGPLVIDANTTVVVQREYLDSGTGDWIEIGDPYEVPFWQFNNEENEILELSSRVSDLENIGLYIIENPTTRDALERHGVDEETITDLYLKLSTR